MKKLICFGDSITARDMSDDGTERLTARLRNKLTGWEVINAGVNGNTTEHALLRLEKDVLDHSPDLVTILLGANDAATTNMVDTEKYRDNLLYIVNKITPEKVILITPAPVDELRPRNRTNDSMQQYANMAKQVASVTGCRLVDLFTAMYSQPDYESMLSDGLHFTASGYVLFSQLVLDEITAPR